jgi:hypothetical protein
MEFPMQGMSMATVLGILTVTEREIKRCQRERPEPFRHLIDSDSVNDRAGKKRQSWGEQRGKTMAIGLMQNVNR